MMKKNLLTVCTPFFIAFYGYSSVVVAVDSNALDLVSSGINVDSQITPYPQERKSPLIEPISQAPIPLYQPSIMFGSQLFRGAFAGHRGSAFNQSYIINVGDSIQLRLWGAYSFTGNLVVDPQGNIFIPNVGPLKVSGLDNGKLQKSVEQSVRQVYRANVGVYAALETAQPVKVFVTGFVVQPGYYGGVSADSVLSYLDRAGGVDPDRGSYVDIEIRRHGLTIQNINLYDFLLAGNLEKFSFKEGDVIVVAPKKHVFSVSGEVYNGYNFEFSMPSLTIATALDVARLKPSATHVSIKRRQGTEYKSEYYPISKASQIVLQDGDELHVSADRFAGTIQIRVEGAHAGEHSLILPYGSTLKQVINQLKTNALSQVSDIQLYRKSVADRQKTMLDQSLDKIEEATFSVRSSTSEEASLRLKDAELIKQFISRARLVKPKGQVVIGDDKDDVILEQDDVLVIPEKTSVIMVHGEVSFPNALIWKKGLTAQDYINQVGGYTQSSNKSKIIIIHPNGAAELVKDSVLVSQGDELMVLPQVSTKKVEVARGLSTILYQIAIAAKVVLSL